MPFTIQQFNGVFADYNETVFPAQLLLIAIASYAIILAFKPHRKSSKIISSILSFLWLWMGIVYHLMFFSRINSAAFFFGAGFIAQAILIFYGGVLNDKFVFRFREDKQGLIGIVFIVYALVIYPLIGLSLGRFYPETPTFGLPCPTTIFTFAFLMWADKKLPFYFYVIPLAWSLIGAAAAFAVGIREDIGLLLAGVIGVFFLHSARSEEAILNK